MAKPLQTTTVDPLNTDEQEAKRVRIAEQRGRISPQGLKARACGAWNKFKSEQSERGNLAKVNKLVGKSKIYMLIIACLLALLPSDLLLNGLPNHLRATFNLLVFFTDLKINLSLLLYFYEKSDRQSHTNSQSFKKRVNRDFKGRFH
ncbi:hypothetical protein J6E39_08360 [bacterium]|nr:hypothetical protein [bacterium]